MTNADFEIGQKHLLFKKLVYTYSGRYYPDIKMLDLNKSSID